MKQVTRWRPDTCKCVIDYEWDDAVPDAERVHTPKIVTPCPIHAARNTDTDPQLKKTNIFAEVLGENQEKNKAVSKILAMPEFIDKTTNQDGSESVRFKTGKDVRFSFDEDRNLQLELVGFSALEKTQALAEIAKDKTIKRTVGVKQ